MIFLWNYIREIKEEELMPRRKFPKWITKWIMTWRKWVHYGKIEKIDEKSIVYILPKESVLKKIKEEKEYAILSKNLKISLQKESKNKALTFYKSSRTFQYLIEQTLKYIIVQLGEEDFTLERIDVYFLMNHFQKEYSEILTYFLEKVKTMNVVTMQIQNYMQLEEKWEKEKGILITVSNNKRKSLKKAKWIVNFDFTAEQLATYNLYRNAVILNMTDESLKGLTAFEGITVQQVEIKVKEELEGQWKEKGLDTQVFDTLELYETRILRESTYAQNVRKAEENEVKVIHLIGNNGRIAQKELLGKKIFLTN